MIDGRLGGLGGVTGPAASAFGMVWLALSIEATRYPLAIIKEARRQLEEIMVVKRSLATLILDGDEASMRFAVFLGFHAENEPVESRAGRRTSYWRLSDDDPYNRLQIGRGSAVVLCYQGSP